MVEDGWDGWKGMGWGILMNLGSTNYLFNQQLPVIMIESEKSWITI